MLRESADIQYGYIKGYVNITCKAEAEPPATFTWYRNNVQLHSRHHKIINGEHFSVLQVKFFFYYTRPKVKVENLNRNAKISFKNLAVFKRYKNVRRLCVRSE